jgi:hypothetical protein
MSKTYDIEQTTAGILSGLDQLNATEPQPARAERVGKRAILAQDAVRARIREMIEAGYQPAQIAKVCDHAGMPVLARTITEICASNNPGAGLTRRSARRKRRSRRKTSAEQVATGPAASAVSDHDVAGAPATEPPQSGTALTPSPGSTDPNDELRRLLAEGDEDSGGGAGRKKRHGNFIGED